MRTKSPREPARPAAFTFDPARILFQGRGVLAVDKPAGIPVHRGTDHPRGLAEAVDEWARTNPGRIEVEAGWPVSPLHRLDLEASGVVLLGLTREATRDVQSFFASGQVKKRYFAFVAGPVAEEATIKGKVRSKLRGVYRYVPSRIDYRRLAGDERLSLVEVSPHEGRTHQIRSLFADIGRPLAGDLRYGKPKPARQFLARFHVPCLLLHARELRLVGGISGLPELFQAPLPDEFRRVCAEKGWAVPEN